MRKLLLFTVLIIYSSATNAQNSTGYKQPKDFQLNKSPYALGITQKTVDKTKKFPNPSINVALFGVDKGEGCWVI